MAMNDISASATSNIFLRSASCSRALFTVLNRAFGVFLPQEQRAAHPLAGGFAHKGYQCGMIWGAVMAAGAVAFGNNNRAPMAEAAAIHAAMQLVHSFSNRAGHVFCKDITGTDFSKITQSMKYLFTGKANDCRKLAVKWAPEAFRVIDNSMIEDIKNIPDLPVSCASLAVRKLGGSKQNAVIVAGFAGGIGLSGGVCGALAAAVWMKAMNWNIENPSASDSFLKSLMLESFQKVDYSPSVNRLIKTFSKRTENKLLCQDIIGRRFSTIDEHADYLRGGGCNALIEALTIP